MTTAGAVVTAVGFCWLGMVLAISFLEAPLKFRAPGVTVPIGLGIGRLVFRALNGIEIVFAAAIIVALVIDPPATGTMTALIVAIAALLVQLTVVRPRLTRRSNAVLAGHDAPRSRGHYEYVVLEILKVAALLVGATLLLAHSVSWTTPPTAAGPAGTTHQPRPGRQPHHAPSHTPGRNRQTEQSSDTTEENSR